MCVNPCKFIIWLIPSHESKLFIAEMVLIWRNNKMADAMANYPEGGIHEFTFMLLMAKTEKK